MIANALTLSRIALILPLWWLLLSGGQARWGALAVYLLAGLTDIADGAVARRTNRASALGALLDLVADRLLTAGTVGALILSGVLTGPPALAGLALIARDLVTASLNEALPGRLAIRVSRLERVKIAAQVLGLALLIAPPVRPFSTAFGTDTAGAACLEFAASLAAVTVAQYATKALRVFAQAAR